MSCIWLASILSKTWILIPWWRYSIRWYLFTVSMWLEKILRNLESPEVIKSATKCVFRYSCLLLCNLITKSRTSLKATGSSQCGGEVKGGEMYLEAAGSCWKLSECHRAREEQVSRGLLFWRSRFVAQHPTPQRMPHHLTSELKLLESLRMDETQFSRQVESKCELCSWAAAPVSLLGDNYPAMTQCPPDKSRANIYIYI